MLKIKTKKIIAFLVFGIFLIFTASGCNMVGALDSVKERFTGVNEEVVVLPEDELALELEGAVPSATGSQNIVLYFSNEQGQLVAEERGIPKVEGIARQAMNELVKGPSSEGGLKATIPAGAMLKDINIREDGLAIVDFSKELVQESDAKSEKLVVYSIVNTLTQFPSVSEVQILVDGKQIESLGTVDVFSPLIRDEAIIQ